MTITAESASRAYNAQPLTQPDFKVEGLVNGDQKKDITLSMTKESTITNVGSVSNVIDTTTVRFKGGELPGGYYELPTYKPGTLTITANTDEVTVTITGNHNTLVYNGSEQSVTGFTTDVGEKTITVALKEGSKAEAKGTNAGKYDMGLTKDNFTVTSQNYSNIKVVVVDGYLKIDPITEKVTVTVTEESDTVTYDGQEHSVTGYASIVSDHALYDVANVAETPTDAWTAKGTDAGTYPVGIKSGDFRNTSGNFTNVEFVIVDGNLVITPASVAVVKIAGNTKTVTYNGEELLGKPSDEIVKRGITLVPEGRRVFPDMTVLENMKIGAYLRHDKLDDDIEWCYELFPRLKERHWQLAGTLSGGEQQMLAVARALMSRPKLMMMDEPSLGLAPLIVRDIFQIIREINKQGVTILLIEQNANMALHTADRGYVMETGEIILEGAGRELLENPVIREAYLGK